MDSLNLPYLRTQSGFAILEQANFLNQLDVINFDDTVGLLLNPGYQKLLFLIELNYAVDCLSLPHLTEAKRLKKIPFLQAMNEILTYLKTNPLRLRDQIREAYNYDPAKFDDPPTPSPLIGE